MVGDQEKSAKGDPAALQLNDARLENFVGEEAPEARVGPRSPDKKTSGPHLWRASSLPWRLLAS